MNVHFSYLQVTTSGECLCNNNILTSFFGITLAIKKELVVTQDLRQR